MSVSEPTDGGSGQPVMTTLLSAGVAAWPGRPCVRRSCFISASKTCRLPVHQLVAGGPFVLLERRVVAVVVLLDDLERPAPGEDVAPDEVGVDAVGELAVAGIAQHLDGLAQREVGHAALAVEVVELAAGVLDHLEGLGELAEGGDGGVAGAGGAGVGVVDGHGSQPRSRMPCHGIRVTAPVARCHGLPARACGKLRGRFGDPRQAGVMSFDDLPENWADLPLDTPGLAADVADLVVGHRDRVGGCIGLVLTEPDLTMGQPAVVNDVDDGVRPEEFRPFLVQLCRMLAERRRRAALRARPRRVGAAHRLRPALAPAGDRRVPGRRGVTGRCVPRHPGGGAVVPRALRRDRRRRRVVRPAVSTR